MILEINGFLLLVSESQFNSCMSLILREDSKIVDCILSITKLLVSPWPLRTSANKSVASAAGHLILAEPFFVQDALFLRSTLVALKSSASTEKETALL
jgi:hypothetical protein